MRISTFKKLALRLLIILVLLCAFLAYYQASFILDLANRWVFC